MRRPRCSFEAASIVVGCLACVAVGAVSGCGPAGGAPSEAIRFWAMGREGEVVQELVRDFERENPGIRVEVQQIPWSAAHEKLLTAFVGRSTPDLAQLGNTWVAEFVALGALEPLHSRIASAEPIDRGAFFAGVWDTNVIDGEPYGVPWYVDTRLMFYRKDLLARAGFTTMPTNWSGWRAAMDAVKKLGGANRYAVFFPVNEWEQPIIFGLQAGSTLLADHDTRGAFSQPEFARAFRWYLDVFANHLSPPVASNDIANLYQEFSRGYFAMYVTGPWNLGEFRRRLPPELADSWATAPLPGPDDRLPGVSMAGGSSLVLFHHSRRQDDAWKLVRYLSRADVQLRFYQLSGDLPARVAAWDDSSLAGDTQARAFRQQLEHVTPLPRVPEWEEIASRVRERAELAIRGGASAEQALDLLDKDVAGILEKRRWLLERGRLHASGGTS
ncbi:MAG: sugar ABC transporter substrate-binding protein [bacterium]